MVPRLTLRTRITALTFGVALLAFAFLLADHAAKAPADFNDDTNCRGHVSRGAPDPNDPTTFGVAYKFYCDGPLTGYTILTAPEREVESVETEVFPTDAKGDVIASDSFSCNGTFPGFSVNCVAPPGAGTGGAGHLVGGEFFVNRAICATPRLEPLLYVMYAAVNAKGQAVQSIAGPFDLGRPQGCPKLKKYPPLKIPRDKDTVLTGQEG